MNFLKTLVLLAVLTVSVQAQNFVKMSTLTAAAVSNIVSYPVIVDNFYIQNATTNAATVYFYDSSTTTTNWVGLGTTTYSSYSTNFDVVFTNAASVIVTNTFSGLYTAPTVVAAATNTMTPVLTVIVPGSTVLNRDVKLQTLRGLAVLPTQDLTLITTYRKLN